MRRLQRLEGRERTSWLWGHAQWCWAAPRLGRSPFRSAAVPRRSQAYRDSGRPRDWILVRLSSSGWRRTSRTWRRNSGHEEHAMVGQRHFTRHQHVAPADQPRIRDGMMGGATRESRHQRGAVAGAAGDTMDACGLNGLGEGHRRQDGGESAGQHRLARPGRTKQKEIMVTTPASHFASPELLALPSANTVDLLWRWKL